MSPQQYSTDKDEYDDDRASFECRGLPYSYEVYRKTLQWINTWEDESELELPVFREPTIWIRSEDGNKYCEGAFPLKLVPFEITNGALGGGDYQTYIYIVSNEFGPCPTDTFIDEMYHISKPWLREKNMCPRERYGYKVVSMEATSIKEVMNEIGRRLEELIVSDYHLGHDASEKVWDLWLPRGEAEQPLLECFKSDRNDGNCGEFSCRTLKYTYGFIYWTG